MKGLKGHLLVAITLIVSSGLLYSQEAKVDERLKSAGYLNEFVGIYADTRVPGMRAECKINADGILVMTFSGTEGLLEPIAKDEFIVSEQPEVIIQFKRNEDGNILEVTYPYEYRGVGTAIRIESIPMLDEDMKRLLGQWEGKYVSGNRDYTVKWEFVRTKDGKLTATAASPEQDSQISGITDISLKGDQLNFRIPGMGGEYTAKLNNDSLTGIYKIGETEFSVDVTRVAKFELPTTQVAEETLGQINDARAVEGSVLLFDAAHSRSDGEMVFSWLREEGFTIRIRRELFDHESLDGVDIVTIVIPRPREKAVTGNSTQEEVNQSWQPPFLSPFSPDEITILHDWVTDGGGLVFIFDHTPISNAVEELAAAFGIEVANGWAFSERKFRRVDGSLINEGTGTAFFRRADGTLATHAITDGRSPEERIDLVTLGGGAALRLPPEGQPLLTLGMSWVSLQPEIPFDFDGDTPWQPIGGWCQGGVLQVGQGRIAAFSDAGILVNPNGVAMQEPPWDSYQLQNPQLFLNTLRWLLGESDPKE